MASRKKVPLIPMSMDKAMNISRHFLGIGESLSHMFPAMHFELEQAKFDYEPRQWMALAFFSGLFYFLLTFGSLFTVFVIAKMELTRAILFPIVVGFTISAVSFVYILFYPKLFVTKKVKDLESHLPHMIHHLLIEVRSGVPLYNALVSVAKSKYGILSEEFKRAVNEINTGKSEIMALEMIAKQNPSLYFRRILWQIINAMKSGADIGETLKHIAGNIAEEQRVSIKKYGSQLNPLTLMYMMFCVIFPTLGITFLLVISSFMGMGIDLHYMLMLILGFLVMFQFVLIGLIKSKRPVGV
jgi:flagellar protein FlaJ